MPLYIFFLVRSEQQKCYTHIGNDDCGVAKVQIDFRRTRVQVSQQTLFDGRLYDGGTGRKKRAGSGIAHVQFWALQESGDLKTGQNPTNI